MPKTREKYVVRHTSDSLLMEFQAELKSYLIGVGKSYPPDKAEYKWFMKIMLDLDNKINKLHKKKYGK